MAIQNDNTLVTKGDLKSLYTDKIAPYLGGGISYYYTDRTGEELKSIDMRLSASQTVNAGSTQNTLINFDKSSGTYETNNHKVIIPAGQRIQINVALQASPGASNAVDGEWQIYDYTNDIIISKANFTYIGSGYSWSSTKSVQYTAPENGALVGVKVTALFYNTSVTASSSFTIQEIGRIVDPIKYMDNNSDLEETPVGNIISYMGNSVPKHHLACDGTEYAIGTYPELEAHIIKEFGSINYFGGDGTTTWAVPNLNGEFLRGTGTNSHTNQGSGANVGVHQDSTEFPAYYTGIGADNKYYIGFRVPNNVTSSDYNIINKADKNISKTSTSIYGNAKEDIHGTASTSNVLSTVRPTNTSVKFCIKYESTYHVIVPSHMYKVSVPFSVKPASNAQIAILDTTNIKGDSSLISGGNFVAPITGWYMCSGKSRQYNWTSGGDGRIVCYWRINGDTFNGGTYADCSTYTINNIQSINLCSTIYLNKGDTINLYVYGDNGWTNTTFEGNLDFCLLTANHKDNIIAGGEVYSEEEQVIGTWKDGKPLYQKTVNGKLGTITDKTDATLFIDKGINNLDRTVNFFGVGMLTNGAAGPLNASWNSNVYHIFTTEYGSDLTKFQVTCNRASWSDANIYITLQYTKTTDTAGTYKYKNSLLLTRPDMWEPNTEYDFGGGLYGQRFTGNMPTIAAGKVATRIFQYTISSSATLVSCGGHITGKNAEETRIVITPNSVRRAQQDNTTLAMGWSSVLILDDVLLMNVGSYARDHFTTSDTYDVWVTYKK